MSPISSAGTSTLSHSMRAPAAATTASTGADDLARDPTADDQRNALHDGAGRLGAGGAVALDDREQRFGHRRGRGLAAEVARERATLFEQRLDPAPQSRRGARLADVPQHELGRQDERDRVGEFLAGELGRGAVHRLEHRAAVAEVGSGHHAQAADEPGAEVREQVAVEFRAIDTVFLELVLDPSRYDMLVSGNLDGDLLSDLCAGFVGGLGVVPGANLGDGCAVFEAVHGTAPELAGKDTANPIALILSAELMLRHIGEIDAASRLRRGVETLLEEGRTLTRDLGGKASTTTMTAALLDILERDGAAAPRPPSRPS